MKYLIVALLLSINVVALGQRESQNYVEPAPFYGIFGRKSKIKLSERLKNYPFNKTAEIQLVSFDGGGQIENPIIKPGMPNKQAYLTVLPFQEIKKLNTVQIDSLTDILYNFGYLEEPNMIELAKCYEPRNGILFLDKKGKIFSFIEICFDCRKISKSNKKITVEEELEAPKIELLKSFFEKAGIEYGITKKFKSQS